MRQQKMQLFRANSARKISVHVFESGRMKSVQVETFGQAPSLRETARPDPGPGDIGVRIKATSLNFADLLMVKGEYQDIPPPPVTLGLECSGVVETVGADVTNFAPGNRVAVFGGHGGLAEFGAFPAERAVLIPDQMPFTEAAAFQIAYGTSHLALTQRARLKAGETLVVLGAAGGVGLTAVEIGAHLGARVIAVARGTEKLEVARKAGAEILIDSEAGGLRDRLRDLGRADVVYDAVGGEQFTQALHATNPGGRLLLIGFASGKVPELKANHMLVKNIDVLGFYWGGYTSFAPERVTESLREVLGLYEAGAIKPHISHVLPLERALEGLEILRSRRSTGKIVIVTE